MSLLTPRETFGELASTSKLVQDGCPGFWRAEPAASMPEPASPAETARMVATFSHPEHRAPVVEALMPDIEPAVKRLASELDAAVRDYVDGQIAALEERMMQRVKAREA